MYIRLILFFILIVLSGCNDNDSSQLTGVWESESCRPTGIPNVWFESTYDFEPSGEISIGRRAYTNSSCIGDFEELDALADPLGSPVMYTDLGVVMLQEGIDGHSFQLTFPTGFIDPGPIDGFYVITGRRLCLSDKFIFSSLGIGYSESGSLSIDFENCLVRVQ